tara:strand:+ start:667 stop:891 length:225 start_codon:yes stop_codon:yes gene_type:complete
MATQAELAVVRALNDAEDQIERGTMAKEGEDCPDGWENFHTLALLYSDDEDIADQDACEAAIYAALEEKFPEYA